jgi:LemA protein
MYSEILYVFIFALLIWIVIIYNRLVIDKNRVLTAWSDIDVQLKRRHDLIPKLVDTVKQYAGYESASLYAITELRAQSERINAVADVGRVEKELGGRLRNLMALAENYPELKASQSFLDLQYNLTDLENHIQFARRYYNGAVRNLNIRIESFPDMLVARIFGFAPAQFFDFDDGQDVDTPA